MSPSSEAGVDLGRDRPKRRPGIFEAVDELPWDVASPVSEEEDAGQDPPEPSAPLAAVEDDQPSTPGVQLSAVKVTSWMPEPDEGAVSAASIPSLAEQAVAELASGLPRPRSVHQEAPPRPRITVAPVAPAAAPVAGRDPEPLARSGSPRHDPDAVLRASQVPSSAPAQWGWRGVLNGLGLRLAPSAAELADREDRVAIAQPFSRTMRVMVANPKGEAGKTPTTLALAGALGQVRGDGICAWDCNEARGNMHVRTDPAGSTRTVRDLLDAMDSLTSPWACAQDVRAYTRRQVSGRYDALVSQSRGGVSITGAEFAAALSVLSRFYSVLVIDTGNSEAAETWKAAASVADALVVPTPWAQDGCYAAAQMLSELVETGREELVSSATLVITGAPGTHSTEAEARWRPYFAERIGSIVTIPTDAHIHARGVIEHDALKPETARAYTHLAAEVVAHLRDVDSGPSHH